MHSKFPKKYNCLRKSTDPQEIDGCSSNTSLILNKQSIHTHNHRQCWCQQYSIDVSMGTALIYPQPVNITSSESIDWPKRPWRQFTINYSAVCWIPRTNENKHTTPTTHTRSKTETDEALSESTQNQGRLFQLIRILQWKINASDKQNCHQPQLLTVQNHIRGIKVLNTNTLMHQANSVSDKLYTRYTKLGTP